MRFCSVCDTDPKFYDTIRDNIRDCVGFVLSFLVGSNRVAPQ